jgi:hypothetical protein
MRVTPTVPGAIVRADAGKPRHSRLYLTPTKGKVAQAAIHYHCGAAFALAEDVHAITTHIHQLTWSRELLKISCGSLELVVITSRKQDY